MSLINSSHREALREAGWRTRGYLPHFDGRAIPQFITLRLADSVPTPVIDRWRQELKTLEKLDQQIILGRRIEKYLDQGYGECFLRDNRIAKIVQDSLLKFDSVRYNLFSWVVMPNHSHSLMTRFADWKLEQLMR